MHPAIQNIADLIEEDEGQPTFFLAMYQNKKSTFMLISKGCNCKSCISNYITLLKVAIVELAEGVAPASHGGSTPSLTKH